MTRWAAGERTPWGSPGSRASKAYNFALHSKDADSVTLLLYREDDVVHPNLTYRLDDRQHKSWGIWHCRLPKAALHGARYDAYVAPHPPSRGCFEWHHFDPQKLFLDSYEGGLLSAHRSDDVPTHHQAAV
jgi:isoamylase